MQNLSEYKTRRIPGGRIHYNLLSLTMLIVFILTINMSAVLQKLPNLEKRGQAVQLVVDGKPFLVLGGEMYNLSSSNLV
nr:hypothetical protein [Mucilaginibacter sp. X5P1]